MKSLPFRGLDWGGRPCPRLQPAPSFSGDEVGDNTVHLPGSPVPMWQDGRGVTTA